MALQEATCAPANDTLDQKRQFDMARSLNQQINTLEKTNGHTVLNSRPLRIGFDISNVCNAKCIFCLADTNRRKKSDPDAFRPVEWLDNFDPLLPYIDLGIFSSYEALMNPDFHKFVDKLHTFHTPFQVFTNGKALTPDMSEYMLRRGLASLHCSFHSPSPSTYESIMKGLSFDQVLTNLMQLKLLARKHNPAFHLVMVFCAMRRNIEQLLDYVDIAHRVGARSIQVNYLMVTRESHKLEQESMFFHQDLYDSYVHAAKIKAHKLGIALNHQPLFQTYQENSDSAPCYRPWETLNVQHTGDVNICCGGNCSPGNIFKDDFVNIWNGKMLQAFRRTVNSPNPPAACKKCTRGKENPKDICTHITYLRRMPEEKRAARINELMAAYAG